MSFRKSFQRPQRLARRTRSAARGLQINTVAAHVESLEQRTLLTATLPGLDEHGLAITNAQAVGQVTVSVTASSNPLLSNNANGSGLFISLDNTSGQLNALKNIRITDVDIAANGNAGAQINLTNLNLDSLILDRARITGNGGSGLVIDLTNSSIKQILIWDSTNNFDPTVVTLPNSGASAISGNAFDGITFLSHGNSSPATIESLRLAGNILGGNARHGAYFELDNIQIQNLSLEDNEVTANNGSGVHFETNRTRVEAVSTVLFNRFDGNTSHGLSFHTQSLNGAIPTATASYFWFSGLNDNSFSGNGGSGVSVDLAAKTVFIGTLLRNTISNNQFRGFDLKAVDQIGAFDVVIGGLATNPQQSLIDGNAFANNVGAAISLDLNDSSGDTGTATGRFLILGNTITGTIGEPGSLTHRGDGINVRARGSVAFQNGAAVLYGSVIDRNTIQGNSGDGVRFVISEDSELVDLVIGNNNGVNQTFDVNGSANAGGGNVDTRAGDGNLILDNGGNGISILRLGSSYVKNIDILDNQIRGNAEGLYLQASNTYETVPNAARPNLKVFTDFTIDNNDLSNNRSNGVHLRTEFNAVLLADMRYNRIDNNAQNGIRVTGVENNIADFENVGGRWIKNAITNSGQNGIQIETVVGSVNPLIIGQVGVDSLDGQSLGNYIAFNGEDGIEVGARAGLGGTVTPRDIRDAMDIVNNLIVFNGRNAVGSPYTAGKGIDIELVASVVINRSGQTREFRIDHNVIQGNAGDGIEINNRGGQLRLTAQGNFIDLNGGRGVDLLNQAASAGTDAEAYVRFGGPNAVDRNIITNNGLEGFYVVNTSAPNQTQDVDSETPLATWTISGSRIEAGVTVNLILDVENNEIRDNGGGVTETGSPASTLSGTGLVLRVGSQYSAGGLSTAPDLTGSASVFSDSARAGVGTNGFQIGGIVDRDYDVSANGRVNARIVDNEFSGNGGDDVLIEGFVSLLPRTTNGNWDQNNFAQGTSVYDRDPLSRLNLEFHGNTGDSINVVRTSIHVSGQTVAYTNDENVFKSRTSKTAPNVSGPHGSNGSRARLVSRVAGPATQPGTPGGAANFWYDGWGASTLRVESNWDVSGFTNNEQGDDFFELWSEPTSPTPVGWDFVAPDTFSYLTASIDDMIVNEADGTVTLTVTLSEDSVGNTFIQWQTADGTAFAGSDYVADSGFLIIADGQRTGTITVAINNDSGFDPGEQFYVDLISISNGNFVDTRGVVSVRQAPQIIISDGTIVEGDNGTKTLDFTVQLLTDDPSVSVSVDVSTIDGTAFAGTDYNSLFGTLTFGPGESIKTVSIEILGDLEVEANETFAVTLSNAVGATIEVGSATGTILDDDNPSITISDPVLIESEGVAVFTVTLSKAVNSTVTVDYTTVDGIALAGSDFVASAGTVTFAAGETTQMILVSVINDADSEGIETFSVQLSNPTNATIADAEGLVTINDDDTPSVSISAPAQVVEGDGTKTYTFTVTLSKPSTGVVTVNYETADQTANAGVDYVAIPPTTLVFNPGQTTKTVTVTILGDGVIEPVETFAVNLSGAVGGNITTSTAVATIVDDDTPTISVADVGALETEGVLFFTVTLSKPVNGSVVTVDFATASNTAAGSGLDYTDMFGTVTFLPGETVKTIFVPITRDVLSESVETFFLDLSNPTNGVLGTTRATASIVDGAFSTGLVVAPSTGSQPQVKVYDARMSTLRFPPIVAYPVNFTGGVRVAVADVNGDGVADIITAPATNAHLVQSMPYRQIRVFDGRSGAVLGSFNPFSPGFTGGFSIAAADLNGDGRAEIIIGTASQLGVVRIFNGATVNLAGAPQILASYYAFSPAYTGGVNVAVGNVAGDSRLEIVASTNGKTSPAVRIFHALSGTVLGGFNPFAAYTKFTAGVNVAVGDVDGNGHAEIIASMTSVGSIISIWNASNPAAVTFRRYLEPWPGFTGGVNVGVTDSNFDGRAEIIVTPASNSTPGVRVFDGVTGQLVRMVNPFENFRTGGYVAGETLTFGGSPLRMADAPLGTSEAPVVTQSQVDALAEAAARRFAEAGASVEVLDRLATIKFTVADLPDTYLGLAGNGAVVIDANANGLGWFVDSTPDFDEEFVRGANGVYQAASGQAAGKVDLLTVLTHELAHQLGFDDLNPSLAPNSLMTGTLPTSVRRSTKEQMDDLFADDELLSELLLV